MPDVSTYTRIIELCRQGREGFRGGRPEQAVNALDAISELALHAMAASGMLPPVLGRLRPNAQGAGGQSVEQARLQLLRLKTANKALAAAYESTITAFHKFRDCLDVVQQLRSVHELPALCHRIEHLFELTAVELVMATEALPEETCPAPTLQDDTPPIPCPASLEAALLASAWAALEEAVPAGSGHGGYGDRGELRRYIGPASALEYPAAFFPMATAQSPDGVLRGSCFIFPFRRGNTPGPIGFLSLLDADPARYTPDKATDYLEHFCAVFEAIIFTLLEKESVSGRQYLDPLTGIRNRAYLEHYGRQLLEQAGILDIPICLLFLDLDNFKPVNDIWGHETGDLVLKEVARLLDRVSRRGDVVCRLGGDEFIVLLPDASAEEAAIYANRVHAALATITPQSLGLTARDKPPFQVQASIGTACHSGGMDLEALLHTADMDMYAIKRSRKHTATPRS
ncbi:GGDEF domain-containing protein [Megalodesulfovibrio paquesii]